MKTINATSLKTAFFKNASFILTLTAILTLAGLTPASAQNSASRSDATPALLMGFSGAVGDNGGILSWTMENETNSKWFVIERSGNGNRFDSIGVVIGLNNSHQTDYTYTDSRMLPGNNYYRLRVVDRDNVSKYSKVVTLTNDNITNQMQVFPNPAGAVVNYTFTSAVSGQVTVEVFNMAGVILMSRQQQLFAGVNQQSLSISTLKSGNYFLKVISKEGNNQYVQPFIKLM